MTAFKVRLRVPPSSGMPNPARSETPRDKEEKPDPDVTMQSDSVQGEPSSGDELMDEVPSSPALADEAAQAQTVVTLEEPSSGTDTASTPLIGEGDEADISSTSLGGQADAEMSASAKKRAKARRVVPPAGSISAVAATLTLEELDALPSAKRRKGLKTRGAPGPGRGWRKGLSKGQKPVYRLPGLDISTADLPQHQTVHPTTPASFVKSTDAPRRGKGTSSSPAPSLPTPGPTRNTAMKVAENAADIAFRYPAIPSLKDAPELLPLAKVPNFIPAATPVNKPAADMRVRPWQRRTRQIMSLGGRVWQAPVWLSEGASRTTTPNVHDDE